MVPVQQVLPEAVAALIRRAPLTPEKVDFAWRSAVGPAMAQVTTIRWREGVLLVEARDGAWQREIQRSAALIRSRLRTVLGEHVVRRLDVRVR